MKRLLSLTLVAILAAVVSNAAGEDHVEVSFTTSTTWTNDANWRVNVGSVAVTIPGAGVTNLCKVYVVHGTTSNLLAGMESAVTNFQSLVWVTDGGPVRLDRRGSVAGAGKIAVVNTSAAAAKATIDVEKE